MYKNYNKQNVTMATKFCRFELVNLMWSSSGMISNPHGRVLVKLDPILLKYNTAGSIASSIGCFSHAIGEGDLSRERDPGKSNTGNPVGLDGLLLTVSWLITCEDIVRGRIDRKFVNVLDGSEDSSETETTFGVVSVGNRIEMSGVSPSLDRPMARAIPINNGTITVHNVTEIQRK